MTTWHDPFNERACRQCGCTETNACVDKHFGACWWIERDLCSHCQIKVGQLSSFLKGAVVAIAGVLGGMLAFALLKQGGL